MVPAYNEGARVGGTLQQILDHLRAQQWSAEVVVVDDGSRDNTLEVLNRFSREHPQVRVIENPGNQGKGCAVRNGMLQPRGLPGRDELVLAADGIPADQAGRTT